MATSFTSSLLLPSQFSPKRSSKAPRSTTTLAMKKESHDKNHYNGSRLVDENLIVLRKRIHEMKMIERNYEPPAEWMDWEKSLYADYDLNICEAMGLLQAQLMDTRPGSVLGTVALIALSVPTSTAVILFYLLELAKEVLAGLHIH